MTATRPRDENVSDAAPVAVGARTTRLVTFDAESIRRFAAICGDANPLHHDDAIAAAGRFGTIIASGPHVVALMMGLDATFLSQRHEALGLGFEFRFVRAVPAGVTLSLEWVVSGVEYKASLGGHVVSVEGRAIDGEGVAYVTATGRNLVRATSSRSGTDAARSSSVTPAATSGPAPAQGGC